MKVPFTLHVKNRTRNFEHIKDFKLKKKHVFDELDRTHFQWLVVFVAGIGFLADGYDIYAASLSIPMLNQVYWHNQMPSSVEASLNVATLAGTVIGQIGFGILADVYGRKRMYGLELLIIIVSTVGVAMSASGAADSMSLIGWLISWRLLLGIGIGGDYPLSAVITSEFAPTKSRGRMLATVFFMQPCGYLLATLVAIIALAASKNDLANSVSDGKLTCMNDECIRAVDRAWRWLVGFGAVPAAVAIYLRFTIPESPRYTIDVLNRPEEALEDVNDMELPSMSPDPVSDLEMQQETIHESPEQIHPGGFSRSYTSSPGSPMFRPTSALDGLHVDGTSLPPAGTVPGISLGSPALPYEEGPMSVMSQNPLTHQGSHASSHSSDKKPQNDWDVYFTGVKDYFWNQGFWVVLLSTSLTWFCFDFAFYVMGPYSYQVVELVFNASFTGDVYGDLMGSAWHSLVIVSIGSILGGLGMIFLIGRYSPRTLQLFGFLIVFVMFITVGLVYQFLSSTSREALVVFLYVISMIFCSIGPNFTTYIIPAELFPTQFRCFGFGVSAASAKLAAVIVQIFAAFSPIGLHSSQNKWFGYFIVIFGVFMLIGAAVTKWLTPETRLSDGKSQPLENLEYIGRKWPLKKKQKEKNEAAVTTLVARGEEHPEDVA